VIARRHFCLSALGILGRAQNGGGGVRADLSTWESVGSGSWTAEDNEVLGRSNKQRPGRGYLFTRQEFTDFRLTLSFWISIGGSSCIFFREPKRRWGSAEVPACSYAVQISYKDRESPTGSLANLQKARKVVGAEEQWNDMEIVCRGPEVRAQIAGQSVNRFNQVKVQAGVIGFALPETAADGFIVRFRDVVVVPIS
jgi:hypothetical protein